jgi:hypothetical protein
VLVESSPQAAIDDIAGHMWKKDDAADLAEHQQRFRIVSSHLVAGRRHPVHAETRPDRPSRPPRRISRTYFMKLSHASAPVS